MSQIGLSSKEDPTCPGYKSVFYNGVPTARMETAVKRIFEYVIAVKRVEKAPEGFFETIQVRERLRRRPASQHQAQTGDQRVQEE